MKQDVDSSSNLSRQPEKAATKKPEKNLYEPYVTPAVLYHLIRVTAIALFSLLARMHIRGRYNIPRKGPFIVASNHLSWTDIPLVAQYVPSRVVYMAKEESFHSRVGWLVRFLGAFPVKRGEGDRRAIKAADDQLKKGKIFVIFPEGTRSKIGVLGKAYAGLGMIALRSGVPVIPVAVWGSEHALKKFRPDVTIQYGEPVILKPKGNKITRDDIESSTDEIMLRIAAMLPPHYRGAYSEQLAAPSITSVPVEPDHQ
ncbi:MAG TPA: lysophospholipid acyltransferase family protein [Ktedonobacteraceae bacterium]|jgi:1-acyl-sn-glycerol-3-phosphate acyltransferase|nr:lysophospholipid acyltransferase family protein [Ktedonobacteraceae bacterium]